MKTPIAPIFALLLCAQVMAFDPVGPPPKKTVEWTASYITNVTIPRIELEDFTTLGDCIDFIRLSHGAPKEYRVEIDVSALGEAKLRAPIHLKIQARNVKIVDMLAKLADAVQADLVINAGSVRLVPKAIAGAGVDQSATKPADKVPAKGQPSPRTSKDLPR